MGIMAWHSKITSSPSPAKPGSRRGNRAWPCRCGSRQRHGGPGELAVIAEAHALGQARVPNEAGRRLGQGVGFSSPMPSG